MSLEKNKWSTVYDWIYQVVTLSVRNVKIREKNKIFKILNKNRIKKIKYEVMLLFYMYFF